MLRRQNLRRRHQRHLVPILNRHQRRLHRNDRLTRTHITLQQTTHRLRPAHIARNLSQHPLLRRRRMKRKHLLDRLTHLHIRHKRRALALPHPPPLQLQPQLQIKQLLKDQPAMPRRTRRHQLHHRRPRLRKMHRLQSPQPPRQLQPRKHRPRQRLHQTDLPRPL